MTTAIQLLRSGEANLRPDPITLADGMPMVNTNEQDPGLYFRLENNTLCKIGPAHVGPLQPNLVPKGFSGNTKGEIWLNKVAGDAPDVLKIYDGTQWVDVGGAAQGLEGSVQYFKNGSLAGDSSFVYDDATLALSVGGLITGTGLDIGPAGDTDFVQIVNDGTLKLGTLTLDNSLVTGSYSVKWPAEGGTLALLADIPGGVIFYGNILVSNTAPAAAAGHLYVNTATAVADASWIGIAGQTVIEDQYVFYTAANQWELGGTSNLSNYVTLDSAQTIAASKTFSAATQFNGPLNLGATATIAGANIVISGSTLTTILGAARVTGAIQFDDTVAMAADLTSTADISCVDLTVSGDIGTAGALTAGSLGVTGNSVLTTVTATDITASSATLNGALSSGTLSTSGLATLDSLTVTGNTSITTLSANGLATIASLAVAGSTSTATLVTTGLASLESLTVTNASNVSALTASGLVTADSLVVTTSASCANLSVTSAAGINSLSVTNKATSASTVAGDPGATLVTKDFFDENAGRWFDDVADDSLYPKTASRDVLIGGILPSAPNISLNADGSINAAGNVTIENSSSASRVNFKNLSGDNSGYVGVTLNNDLGIQNRLANGNVSIYTNNTRHFDVTASGNVLIGGTLPASPNIELNASGSATFADFIKTSSGVTNESVELFPNGGSVWNRSVTDNASNFIRCNAAGTEVFRVACDGAADFAGQVSVGADAFGINNTGSGLTPTGSVIARRAGSANLWLGYQVGTTQQTSQISADGSSQFAGDIAIGGTLPASPNIELNADGTVTALTFDIDALPPLP